jgi:hypothetical protein
MRITEISTSLKAYTARVRVDAGGTKFVVRTQVIAAGAMQARALLTHLYGARNVLSIS